MAKREQGGLLVDSWTNAQEVVGSTSVGEERANLSAVVYL